jgi:hypothetical protein
MQCVAISNKNHYFVLLVQVFIILANQLNAIDFIIGIKTFKLTQNVEKKNLIFSKLKVMLCCFLKNV